MKKNNFEVIDKLDEISCITSFMQAFINKTDRIDLTTDETMGANYVLEGIKKEIESIKYQVRIN